MGQILDYTSLVKSNPEMQNYGHATPNFVLARQMQCNSLRVVDGMDETQPVIVHMWREGPGKFVVLAGNLEGNNCAGLPCSVPTALSSRTVTVSIDTGPARLLANQS